MSIYEQCNATADARKSRHWATYRQETWWKNADVWDDPGRNQSTTERDAYRAILHVCGRFPANRYDDMLLLVYEVVEEMRRERSYSLIPLKEYLARRHETLYWRDAGLRPAAYVVPLIASGD